MKNELETSVEEIKQDADVQRALKQATPAVEAEEPRPTRLRDKLVIGTHVLSLIALFVVHKIISFRFLLIYDRYTLIKNLIIAVSVAVVKPMSERPSCV